MLSGGAAILCHLPIFWQTQREELFLRIYYCATVHYGLLLVQGMSVVVHPSPSEWEITRDYFSFGLRPRSWHRKRWTFAQQHTLTRLTRTNKSKSGRTHAPSLPFLDGFGHFGPPLCNPKAGAALEFVREGCELYRMHRSNRRTVRPGSLKA